MMKLPLTEAAGRAGMQLSVRKRRKEQHARKHVSFSNKHFIILDKYGG